LQDTWLFKGSLLENIRYGRLDATDEEVIEAARATHVDDFARQLPDGYDTVVDGDESTLPAGEKPLVTIARAFLAQPALLILDEATSSVDTRTEVLVQKAMNALREGRTSFVIAHRLSTIRDADLILVMEDGDIVEQGDHEALLALGGAYSRLYRSQFEGAAVDIELEEELAGHADEDEAPTTTGPMALGGRARPRVLLPATGVPGSAMGPPGEAHDSNLFPCRAVNTIHR